MARTSTTDAVGLIAMILGGLLVMGGLFFLSAILLMPEKPPLLLVPGPVQIALGFLGSIAGYFLRRGHSAAKFALIAVAVGVAANFVFLVVLWVIGAIAAIQQGAG